MFGSVACSQNTIKYSDSVCASELQNKLCFRVVSLQSEMNVIREKELNVMDAVK